ncbi:MAG: carboxy-S-adenosyl-L-methionine synthase CmoA [Bacteroidota bacterium]|jgi:tRNA (cmo5U34)-methyltransferase
MDKIFDEPIKQASDFAFNNKVAGVFDDMVTRSVPYYIEMQRMMSELVADQCSENGVIYDLGCSTGATMIMMDQTVPQHIKFVGIDDSAPMLEKCKTKLEERGMTRPYSLEVADLNSGHVAMKDASVVILCLTLQFVRPIAREKLLRSIHEQLQPGGVLIVIEKILAEETDFNRDFIKYYYDFKRRNDYSEMEISQKREALENILIPYKLSENITLLKEVGFRTVEVFFKWYNFSGFIAKKLS